MGRAGQGTAARARVLIQARRSERRLGVRMTAPGPATAGLWCERDRYELHRSSGVFHRFLWRTVRLACVGGYDPPGLRGVFLPGAAELALRARTVLAPFRNTPHIRLGVGVRSMVGAASDATTGFCSAGASSASSVTCGVFVERARTVRASAASEFRSPRKEYPAWRAVWNTSRRAAPGRRRHAATNHPAEIPLHSTATCRKAERATQQPQHATPRRGTK